MEMLKNLFNLLINNLNTAICCFYQNPKAFDRGIGIISGNKNK